VAVTGETGWVAIVIGTRLVGSSAGGVRMVIFEGGATVRADDVVA
jgi:hypothetical protein